MADSLSVTPGSGAKVLGDEVTIGTETGIVQYVKLVDGTNNSTNVLLVDSSGRITAVVSGTVATAEVRASTATRTNVAASATSVTLLAANTSRKDSVIYNDSTANLYVGLGAVAVSTSSFTVLVAGGGYYEVPYGYTGEIRGLWSSATGSARVTELT